uniref:Uncharacterized protein n=1 Tax=Acrobeloides nanus TaxID=290746 RepID=A0A914EDM2_9BILA
AIDPDDLMGASFTDEDGTFALDGCGDDFDWIPGMENKPEPYVQILHYCNNDRGETIQMPIFKTFVPQTHDIGIMELDEVESVQISELNPKFNNTFVKLSGQHEDEHESAEAFEGSSVIKQHNDKPLPTLPNYHVTQLLHTEKPDKSLELELLDDE